MECDLELLRFKWQNGVLSLESIIQLVENNVITEKDFFDITRMHYNGVKK